MNRKNIVALFLIVCIVFINIEIKVQAEVIDGKIDWESATILTIYEKRYFFLYMIKLQIGRYIFNIGRIGKCIRLGK